MGSFADPSFSRVKFFEFIFIGKYLHNSFQRFIFNIHLVIEWRDPPISFDFQIVRF